MSEHELVCSEGVLLQMKYDYLRSRFVFHSRNLPATLKGLLALLICTAPFSASQPVEPNKPTSTGATASTANNGKIAVTASSEDARKEFLAGRERAENRRITDSV